MDGDNKRERYFAYGSNLCADQLVRRTGPFAGGEDAPCVARLAGYRVVFNMKGDDGRVCANISQPGDEVIGVLYYCDQAALASLDVYEEGYDRRQVHVTLESGATREAMVYIARPECTTDEGAPTAEYLAIILRGAKEHGLPEDYIATIKARALPL